MVILGYFHRHAKRNDERAHSTMNEFDLKVKQITDHYSQGWGDEDERRRRRRNVYEFQIEFKSFVGEMTTKGQMTKNIFSFTINSSRMMLKERTYNRTNKRKKKLEI
jgi:hypothetical protein